MSAEYEIYISSEQIDEPLMIEDGTSVTITITNVGDETGTGIGFYLRNASNLGAIDYPSESSPILNYTDIIEYGNLGYGLTIVQGLNSVIVTTDSGDNFLNKIPLSSGSGTLNDELETGASVDIILSFSLPPATSSKNLYVDFVVE